MKIWYFKPYSLEKDLGSAYNQYADLISNPEDWLCFLDIDTMFLLHDTPVQMQEIVERYPSTGLFTCYTNRVGAKPQCLNGVANEDPNMLNLYRIALQQQTEKRYNLVQIDHVISGFLMLIQKKTWDLIHGAPVERGLLAIDNHISQRVLNAGLKIQLMEGVYLNHYYRLHKEMHDRSHLVTAEQNPLQRVRRKRNRLM